MRRIDIFKRLAGGADGERLATVEARTQREAKIAVAQKLQNEGKGYGPSDLNARWAC